MDVTELGAALGGGRISVLYDDKLMSVSINEQPDGSWFWAAYDRDGRKLLGCGRTDLDAALAGVRSVRASGGETERSSPQPQAAE